MATRTLVDGSTDLTQTSSWSGATLPITGDTVIIPRGSQHIDTFSLAAVRLERLEIAFEGKIESSAGAALLIDVDNTTDALALITGKNMRGRFGGGSTSAKWENLHIHSPGSVLTFTTGEYEDVVHEAGSSIFDANARIDGFVMHGGHATLGAESNGIPDGDIYGGRTLIQRGGTYDIHAGTVELDVTDGSSVTINTHGDDAKLIHRNGDFDGALRRGEYIDALEAPATIGGTSVTIGSFFRFGSRTVRATFTNVTAEGVARAGSPVGL